MAVWRGLTSSCENKRSEKQRRKRKIYSSESLQTWNFRIPLGLHLFTQFYLQNTIFFSLLLLFLRKKILKVCQSNLNYGSCINHLGVYYIQLLIRWTLSRFSWIIQESEVAQSCPTLCNPVDCDLPGSSIHEILHARILEWVAISFSRGSSWPRDWTWVSHLAGRCFNLWATREAHYPGRLNAIARVFKSRNGGRRERIREK